MFSVKDAPRDVVVTTWKQAKDDLGTQAKEDLGKQAKEDLRTQAERLAFEIERLKKKDVELMILKDSRMPPKLLQRKLKVREAEIRKTAARNLLVHKPLAAPGHGRFRMRNKKSRSECLELAKKNNSSSNTTKDEEAVAVGSSKSAMKDDEEVMMMPNKFGILDLDGDDEIDRGKSAKDEEAVAVGSSKSAMKDDEEVMMMPNKFGILDRDGDDEIDRGKSAIEEEHMPSDWKNTSEESVVVGGSGKSAMDQAVISLEREEPVTDALKEAEESVLLVGMDSMGLEPSIRKQSQEGALLLGPQSLLQKEADSDGGRRTMRPMPDLSTVIAAQLQDNLWQPEAETEQKKAHKETEAKKPKSKQKKKKKKKNPKMRMEHVEDSIGNYQFGERNYEGVTHQEATRLEKKHLEQLAKKNKKKVKDEDAGKAVASVKDAGKAEVSVTEAGRPEESVTEAEEALKKEAKEGALLVGMDSTGGVSSMQKQAREGALLLGPDSMADESLLQKEAEAESGKRLRIIVDGKLYPAITRQEAEKLMNEIHERREALKRDLQAKQDAKGKETKAKAKAKAKARAKAKAKVEEAGKAEVSVTEAGRPEESATETEALKKEAEDSALLVGMDSTGGVSSMQMQAEEGALVNSTGGEPLMHKEAEEVSGKRPERQLYVEIQRALLDIQEKLAEKNWKTDKRTLQLLKDMSNKLDMLDQGSGDDETYEIDQTCLDTNEAFFKPGKLFLDPLAKEMADEEESFASYSRLWEYKWGKTRGFFRDPTVISSMQFTHYTPGREPYSMECNTLETLQIISVKLTELSDGLELPLSVYGVVAVRDMVDRKRNILFSRDMSDPQELKQNDPFLHLTGPSRAIVFKDKVCIEIELRVKSGAYSQDKALISCVRRYTGENGPGVSTICFKNSLCTVEVCLQPVEQTVQATILGVQVASEDGSWPLEHGGIVACSPQLGERVLSDSGYTRRIIPSSSQIVLIESGDEAMPKGESGHVLLRRQVVSVQLDGRLDFLIKAYSKSCASAAETRVHFYPKVCNVSQKKCYLGDAGVTITVAWSIVAADKTGLHFELRGGSTF